MKKLLSAIMKGTTVLLRFGAPVLWSAQAVGATWCAEPAPGGLYGCSWTSIQAAIDAAAPGDAVLVYPGVYVETAANRNVASIGGLHQFGLFIGQDKSGITIQGVDGQGQPVENSRQVKAFITTNATNESGPSGIFVEGDDVTITGLNLGTNLREQNKTIEVIGDNFTLEACDIADLQGSVYIHDPAFKFPNTVSHVKSYHIRNNNFQDGVSIDLASGAGFSGSVTSREIRGNRFTNAGYWPSISFNGSGTGVPWFDQPVGGAVIRNNTFVNTFAGNPSDPDYELYLKTEGHIRARGTYDNSQFDWTAYFRENRFDQAYRTDAKPGEVRAYSYASGSYMFENVRRIGALPEGEEANAQPGDQILAKPHDRASPRFRRRDSSDDFVGVEPMSAPGAGRF